MSLEFPESQQIAARYVREAIPMMVGRKIVPNPLNFALWYSYVSNRSNELKSDLDATVNEYGTCPDEVGLDLFRRYIINDEISFHSGLEDSFTEIIDDLLKDVDSSRTTTDSCAKAYQSGIERMQGDKSAEELRELTSELVATTELANHTVGQFGSQLRAADEEIRFLKQQLAIKEQQAYIDPLTNIGNRRFFERKLFELFSCEEQVFSLIFIDLDHFKRLNDRHGHLLGDKVLKATGSLLSKLVPGNATAARYGGEEFVVLFEGRQEDAAQCAETLRLEIEKIRLLDKKSSQAIQSITASFGVAERQPGEFPDQLIARADKALYAAKANGRNRLETAA